MDIHAIAKQLSEEHRTLDQLARELSACVDSIPTVHTQQWLDRTRSTFKEFRVHVLAHMSLEEQDGYMTSVQDRRPALASEIDRLMAEHISFRSLLNSLNAALQEMTPEQPLLIRDTCHRVRDLLAYVRHHENDENMLVLSAYSDDIGTKD